MAIDCNVFSFREGNREVLLLHCGNIWRGFIPSCGRQVLGLKSFRWPVYLMITINLVILSAQCRLPMLKLMLQWFCKDTLFTNILTSIKGFEQSPLSLRRYIFSFKKAIFCHLVLWWVICIHLLVGTGCCRDYCPCSILD